MTQERLMHAASVPFEAARELDILPQGHRARGLHGHSFRARVRASLPEDWAQFKGVETDDLERALAGCVRGLDYRYLNDQLAVPTDENLARWIRERVDIPGLDSIGIRSAADRGADIDPHGQVHVWRRFRFESAHQLPNVPPGHKCGRMHGHGFVVAVHCKQGEHGMGMDSDQLERCWQPLHQELDHACLNDIPGLDNPTSEHIAGWIWRRLQQTLPDLSWVTVYETATAGCSHDGEHYRIWKEMSLDSAVRLNNAPQGDRRRRIHGHSFTVRLHLLAGLDQVMGWVMDYGDVKTLFRPVFERLDHQPLHGLPDLADTDPASLARWTRRAIGDQLPALDRIDFYQTPGCGAILSWGARPPALPI
ncbi:6-carboxytetrahydropterin synthase [Wenzhouxiangella limi]|uniref:6-carboxy-5,6,7,8-tetrahydropterin synthase n=1 Tax=Wenzhouxiangella limi TaxID=2707351 RepID=A0A845V786_9GAMM|nr:6-carboxytetrahydropterin synthase [Wenzhouxiangella limi]NDY95815.1 6-pyruvoyl tetrahydropterin synthase [Wenzhouxiangella limi]